MNRTIRVCGLVPYPVNTAPSQRYRIEQWLPYCRNEGIQIDLLPFVDDQLAALLHQPGRWAGKLVAFATAFARRFGHCVRAGRYDAVLIHRAACLAGPAVLETLLRLLRRPVIFDFDDAIYLLHTTEANRRWGWLKFPGKTATLCRLSAGVIAGNSNLAEYARHYNSHVAVVPSSVDTQHFRPQKMSRSNERIVLGWTGSSTSQTYLELFADVLREVCRRHDVELRVHSDREPNLPGVPFVWRPWSPQTEVEELSAFDIGIMPMPDNPWARGKCAMKALLYMAMAIPVICSAVGTNCEVIRHGDTGFLVRGPEDWLGQLATLIGDATLRKRLGDAGRRFVEEHYSAEACATRFAAVIRQAVCERT